MERQDFAASLLTTWSLFVLVFFSVSSSKLPSYILPMFPAMALLLARLTANVRASVLKKHLLLPALVWTAALLAAPFANRFATVNSPPMAVQALAFGVMLGAAIFLVGAALAWGLLRRERVHAAVAAVAVAHLGASLLVLGSHNTYGQIKSSDAIARILAPMIDATTPVFAVQAYDHTLPFYLRRPVILVDHRDEFEFGQDHEPQRWIPTLDAFVTRWNSEPRAAAYLAPEAFEALRRRGMAFHVVHTDPRRTVVVKP